MFQRWRAQLAEQPVGIGNRTLARAVTVAAALVVAYELAALTWLMVPDRSAPQLQAPLGRVTEAHEPANDFSALQTAQLFGKPPPEPATAEVATPVPDAPDTALALTLTGILFGVAEGQAIITSGASPERTYRPGQSIDGAEGAVVRSIGRDFVLLDRGARLETLRFPQKAANVARSPTIAAAEVADPAAPVGPTAASMTEVIRVAPQMAAGKMIGLRVSPGPEREAFAAVGLQTGDVITEVNGTALDDTRRSQEFFEALGQSTIVRATVLRNGLPQSLAIDPNRAVSRGPATE